MQYTNALLSIVVGVIILFIKAETLPVVLAVYFILVGLLALVGNKREDKKRA